MLTITADNGREFAKHEEIANALDTKVYFADIIVLLKEAQINMPTVYVTVCQKRGDELIEFAQSRINYRSKKCLNFKPAVVFNQLA